jgi:hypothetical protein
MQAKIKTQRNLNAFNKMAQFKYLATKITNQNCMHEEIKYYYRYIIDYIYIMPATIRYGINRIQITNKMQLFTRIYYSNVYL